MTSGEVLRRDFWGRLEVLQTTGKGALFKKYFGTIAVLVEKGTIESVHHTHKK